MANTRDKQIAVFLENELEIDYLTKEEPTRREGRRLLQKTLYYANCIFLARYGAPLVSCLATVEKDGPVFHDLHSFLESAEHSNFVCEMDPITRNSLSVIAQHCKVIGFRRLGAQTHLSPLWKGKNQGDLYDCDEIMEQFPSTEFEKEMFETLVDEMDEKDEKLTEWAKNDGYHSIPWENLVFT
eukprot:CAMPEP_0201522082 /NCGR_PEP_ID=MMETSP0161_2-20130828/16442_1 /ASSEMBLY_ACC=CAM_ASM_000251 /TAXON_ID=180227 /ORGANISM="Neoparamoeba aestuarina, Strain SoJaBio B1-5/56/2" /LENGTH=183 /DNA_ID=CAMNT_0047920841 /DNA_START=25 /DNA_END=576 /DNA_ORIENTATION=-